MHNTVNACVQHETGQVGPFPRICVWEVGTQKLLAKLGAGVGDRAFYTTGISAVSFSQNGKYVLATGMDESSTLGR